MSQALRGELEAAWQERADMQILRDEVADLRAEVASLHALLPAVDAESIDQAL